MINGIFAYRRTALAIIIICILLSGLLIPGAVMAKDGEKAEKRQGPRVKLAHTGEGSPFIAGKVTSMALEDGVEVYDRSSTMFGILRAEASLMEAHGSEEGKAQAKTILKNLESKFFADIWIDFEDNITTGLTTVTIRVGNETNYFVFPTPGPTDFAEIDLYATLIWTTAWHMYQAHQGK